MDIIRKTPDDYRVAPNFRDYERTRAEFDWSDVPRLCEGMGPGGCNIAYAAVDRHTEGPSATRTALRFLADTVPDGPIPSRDVSYAELGRLVRRFTNVLRSLGVEQG